MADEEMEPNLSDPPAQTTRDRLEQQEAQEREGQADASARPPSPVAPGRRPLFRS
jgi:hypothetical protein